MTTTFADIAFADSDWHDICAIKPALSNAAALIQNKGPDALQVFFGGAAKPEKKDAGIILAYGEAHDGLATNIWVRSASGNALLVAELR